MSKSKTTFFCQQCGYESAKWLGKCPSCNAWNTFAEELVVKNESGNKSEWRQASSRKQNHPKTLSEVEGGEDIRTDAGDAELNRVLGGGIVSGSLVLIGGEPGIGKSTLMLQVGLRLKGQKVLYVSGEESEQQIRMRADRIGQTSDSFYVLTETNTKSIFQAIEAVEPGVVIVDSIQTLFSGQLESAAGSIGQVRQCAAELMKFAKETSTPVFLIGHITKDGLLAGPKVLEHMVDTVLQFEGDRHLAEEFIGLCDDRRFGDGGTHLHDRVGIGRWWRLQDARHGRDEGRDAAGQGGRSQLARPCPCLVEEWGQGGHDLLGLLDRRREHDEGKCEHRDEEGVAVVSKVKEISPEEKKAFQAATRPVYDKWKARIGTALVESAEKAVAGR